jgi:hypothetical protein
MDEKSKSAGCGNQQTISSSPFSIFGKATVTVASNSPQTQFSGQENDQGVDCLNIGMGLIKKLFRF